MMPPPEDPFSKIHAEVRRAAEAASLSRLRFGPMRHATELGAMAGLPDHVRQLIEGHGANTNYLDAIRTATRSLGSAGMPDAVRHLFEGRSPYTEYLDKLRNVTVTQGWFPNPAMLRSFADAQRPYSGHLQALRRATEAAGLAPVHAALRRAFTETNAYTQHLDAVRAATTLAGAPAMQDALRLAERGLPTWLRPAASLDMLLPSWRLTAEIGAFGLAQQGLIRDVLGALYRDRPDTIAFDVAVTLAESFDQADDLGAEQTADLLQRCTDALITLYVTTKDWVAKQGIYNMLMLILMISAAYDGHIARVDADEQTVLARAAASPEPSPAQKEITRHLQALETTILERDNAHAAERNIRVVIQSAPLRLAPDAKAQVIQVIYPDDHVRVKNVKGGWALIEVFEYKSEATVTGWINRRVLRLPSSGG